MKSSKKKYTGQYVKADAAARLARFENAVSQIKTVNMNSRALVEFDQDSNHGWYDIPLDCLTVVDKPPSQASGAAKRRRQANRRRPSSRFVARQTVIAQQAGLLLRR